MTQKSIIEMQYHWPLCQRSLGFPPTPSTDSADPPLVPRAIQPIIIAQKIGTMRRDYSKINFVRLQMYKCKSNMILSVLLLKAPVHENILSRIVM